LQPFDYSKKWGLFGSRLASPLDLLIFFAPAKEKLKKKKAKEKLRKKQKVEEKKQKKS